MWMNLTSLKMLKTTKVNNKINRFTNKITTITIIKTSEEEMLYHKITSMAILI